MSENLTRARVACVVPYVGVWPDYSRLFFKSCRHNPGLDVIVVTPQRPDGDLPPNVRVVEMSPAEIVGRLERAVGFKLGSFRWHKLCDLRPFFGLAFADLLKPYEFWGYCDTDIMFGDLSATLDSKHLASIDAFSAHSKQFVGHFTLLRNREDINRLGFEIPQWEELCLTEKAEHLDEERLHGVFLSHPELRVSLPESLDRELEKPFCRHAITYTFHGLVADLASGAADVVTRWQKGKAHAIRPGGRETEILYVHFMTLKDARYWPRETRVECEEARNHYFSRVGYNRARQPEDLHSAGNRLRYAWSESLLFLKKAGGFLAGTVLPANSVRRLRRALKV